MGVKYIYIFTLILSLCIIVGCETIAVQSGSPAIQKGDFPPDLLGQTLDGQEIHLSDFKGKIVVLIFWKTWCNTCKIELLKVKVLRKIYQKEIILLAINIAEPPDKVRSFKKAYLLDFQVLLDPQAKISSAYGIHVWPTTILINQQGQVHWTGTGLEMELLKQEIEVLLREKR
jgi:cytochrome c biogenesis protein CcmG/thiol:disulfide interchange protein DsbE